MPDDTIKTPCIGVCTVGDQGLCLGCFRSMDEITHWLSFSQDEIKDIMQQLPVRLEAMFT